MITIRKTGRIGRSFLLILVVLCSAGAFAQYTLTATQVVSPANCGAVGAVVDISINDATAMGSFQFDLYYDPALITATLPVAGTTLTAGWFIVGNTFADHISVAGASVPLAAGSGSICTINFNVSAAAPDGSSSVLDIRNTQINALGVPPVVETDGIFNIVCGPPCAANPVPADAAVNVAVATALSWDPAAGATSYDVYFGTVNPPPFAANVAVTTYSPAMVEGTVYYWQVVPQGPGGPGVGCPIWSFTTCTSPAAPAAPTFTF